MKQLTLPRLFGLLFMLLILSQFLSVELYQWLVPRNSRLPIELPTLLSSVSSVAIMPVIEEWLFREKLLGYVKRKRGKWQALFISSFCFSLIHLQVFILPFFLGGLVYGIARLVSKKWWFSVLLHSGYNSVALLSIYLEVWFS